MVTDQLNFYRGIMVPTPNMETAARLEHQRRCMAEAQAIMNELGSRDIPLWYVEQRLKAKDDAAKVEPK